MCPRPDFSNDDDRLKRRKAQIARILGGEFLRSVEALERRLDREAQPKREERDRRMAWARRRDLLVNRGGGHYTKPIAEIDGILRPDIDPRTGYQRVGTLTGRLGPLGCRHSRHVRTRTWLPTRAQAGRCSTDRRTGF